MGEGHKIRGHQVGVTRLSALFPITDILGLQASKKKGTGTMAGPLNLLA